MLRVGSGPVRNGLLGNWRRMTWIFWGLMKCLGLLKTLAAQSNEENFNITGDSRFIEPFSELFDQLVESDIRIWYLGWRIRPES